MPSQSVRFQFSPVRLPASLPPPAPSAPAAASSAAVCCILVVVGAVMFRSIQTVRSPGHSWDGVRAANPSWDALGALSLVVLGFAVSRARLIVGCGSGRWLLAAWGGGAEGHKVDG